MPTNITQGNTAQFVVQFISSATGSAIVPSSGALTITYNISGVATSTAISLVLQGSMFTGSWDTTPADLGLATWAVSSPATTNPAQTGQINVIDP